MANQKKQGYYCELIKEEPLSTLEPALTDGNTCVLESTSPFFGYYQDAPMGKPDPHIYCVLDREHSFMAVIRATTRINEKRRNPVDVATGRLFLLDRACPVIRIKHMQHFNQVPLVQQALMHEGISFKKRQRTIREQMGVIHLSKMLYLLPVDVDGLYMDADDPTKAYFEMPGCLSWDDFKSLTTQAKYDTSILYYDAAQATIVKEGKIVDLVRVFRERITEEQLKAISDRYYKLLA